MSLNFTFCNFISIKSNLFLFTSCYGNVRFFRDILPLGFLEKQISSRKKVLEVTQKGRLYHRIFHVFPYFFPSSYYNEKLYINLR